MDRLARLRTRSSAGGPLNASTTSSLAAGYETANDESLTSGSGSMYFSMTEGGGGDGTKTEEEPAEEEPTLSGTTLATSGHSGVDQTLENDFSVEEVSTIRKATIAHASPATVQVAAGMAVKYLGVSSTPAPKTPKAATVEDLSGFDQLDQTPSIMKKMRDPKTPAEMASFAEDPEESKVTLDGSGVQGPVPGNKSYGTNVLANFFASLDVNSGTPAPPEIKISAPEPAPAAATTSGSTPSKRDSNTLENFFESLQKNPPPEVPANKRRSVVRKSLIPKVGSIVAAATKQNRVASPISRRSTTVRLIPDKLREMRKTNQQSEQLVQFRRKSTAVPAAAPTASEPSAKVGQRKSMAVAAVRAVTTAPNPSVLKRKSVVPAAPSVTAVNGRKSVLPAVRRGVVTAGAANPPRVALKIPAKTTLSNGPTDSSTNTNSTTSNRRTLLGKRPATTATVTSSSSSTLPDKLPATAEQPVAKQRKSLAPPAKEASPATVPIRVSPRNKPATAPSVHLQSRIRPPTGIPGFKKPETFTCDQCQRIFRLKSSFETHLKTVHQQPTASASTSTSTNSSLNKSSEASAPTGAGAKCQYCGKAFAGAKFLTNHVVSNCLKIPLLEKRRLLAEGERERAANLKRTPDAAKKSRLSLRPPPTAGSGGASNRSASSTRSGDETDTSTCSSNGGGGSTATGSGGAGRKKRTVVTAGGSAAGGGGISRTPNKELKCHLCARRFLNAVEYALHVQAHAKNLKGGGGDAGGEDDVENVATEEEEKKGKQMTEDVAKLVQKLVTIKNRNGIGGGGKVALKSSNSGNVSK